MKIIFPLEEIVMRRNFRAFANLSALSILLASGTSFVTAGEQNAADKTKAVAAMEAEIEREFFVGMSAIKDLCKERYPKSAKKIEDGFVANLKTAPADVKEFAKSKDFVNRVNARKKEQLEMIKNPEEKTQFEEACANLSSGGLEK
jgi:hypothetical protein